MTGAQFPLPVIDDIDTGGHWQAVLRREIAIRVCAGCGEVLHMPTAYCHACGGWNTKWQVVAPRGILYSWTTVYRQIHPAFAAPYTVVLVELTDLPAARLVGHLPGEPDLVAGLEMMATFMDIGDMRVPVWRPAGWPPDAAGAERGQAGQP